MTLAQSIKDQTAAVSFRSHKFGVRRKLDQATCAQAAKPFAADPATLTASKSILDTRAEAFRQVTDVIRRARRYWKSMTVFYPMRGIRLIRRDQLESFNAQMVQFRDELNRNIDDLLSAYKQMKLEARQKLGQLYASKDYPDPDTLGDEFQIVWGFPNIDPPNYLKELNPALYAQEQARIAARFEEAVAQAEQAVAAELQELVAHLVTKLTPNEDGKRKTLNEKALKGLADFVQKFRQISIHSSPELEAMVKQVDGIAKGLDLKDLKANPEHQQSLFNDVSMIKDTLDTMLIDAPDRKIDLDDDE